MTSLILAALLAAATTTTGTAATEKPAPATVKQIEKQRVVPTVMSVKPVLAEPHVIAISGVVANGVRGGWTYEAAYEFFESGVGDGAVTITLDVWSPKGTVATKNVEKFSTKVEIPDLRDKAGKFELVVKSIDGKELGRGIYEVAAPATAER